MYINVVVHTPSHLLSLVKVQLRSYRNQSSSATLNFAVRYLFRISVED